MKQTIFVVLLCCFLFTKAQYNNVENYNQHQKEKAPVNLPFKITKLTSNQISAWYNMGYLLDNAGATTSYYRTELFPDSTVMVEYSDDWGNPWQHSVGQVFHPTSVWTDFGPGMIDEYTSYVLDSVSVPYRYFRFQDNVEDTLIIQVYPQSSTEFVSQSWGNYIRVFYDYESNLGVNAVLQDTFLLDMQDTAISNQRYIDMPVGMTMNPNEYFAATMSYKPGNEFSIGDTIDPYSTVPITNPINAFLCYYFVDEDFSSEFENEYSFYHGLTVPTDVRYDINENGWNGKYIGGNAWNSGDYQYDMWFHLTTIDLSVEDDKLITMKIFPNPAKSGVSIYVSFDQDEEAELLILDINGKVCGNMSFNISKGISSLYVNTSKLLKGIYTCVLKSNSINLVEKLVVD